ncbi:MAG: type I secretion system permease/ATPase [Alphaproteobacteria bacterium]
MLRDALSACRAGFVVAALFSLGINLLLLTLPFYMWQIFDRVLVSHSVETLLYLSLIAAVAILAGSLLECARSHIMARLSLWLERRLGAPILAESVVRGFRAGQTPSVQPLRDLSTFRGFLGSPTIFAIMDAPWTPIYVGVIFLLHPWLGMLAVAGAVVLFGLALVNDRATRKPLQGANNASIAALAQADGAARNADVVMAMGMLDNITRRWTNANAEMLALQARASAIGARLAAASKFCRLLLQMGTLGIGAWLVLQNTITAGAMIAASILMSRALAPVEQAIVSWRSAIAARGAYRRLKTVAVEAQTKAPSMPLPIPLGELKVEGLAYHHPTMRDPILRNVSFRLAPGESMGIIGPTATGKTTLARLLIGNLKPQSGVARLDGVDVAQWDRQDIGQHVGYLPQDVELFRGTVAENIARMGEVDAATVVAAARLAGVHDLILALPKGYETEIGEGGATLSGGQRQRIALARALYGSPRFVVLDEPNSNLDQAGEDALLNALARLKEQRTTCVIVAHRPNVLRRVDKILLIRGASAHRFGARDEILAEVTGLSREQTLGVKTGAAAHG